MGPIFLIGYRCTGKTSTGKYLADLLNKRFLDTDLVLESTYGTTIAQMVARHGWSYFRAKETETLMNLDLNNAPVIATGGGIILAEENRRFLKENGVVVYLYATAPVLTDRIRKDEDNIERRPDLTRDSLALETKKMLEIRNPLYQAVAAISINTEKYTPKAAALQIKAELDPGSPNINLKKGEFLMDIITHQLIDNELCGKPVMVENGKSRVEYTTTPRMAADDSGLVHGGFIFGLADYAAMLAVNHPNVVLGGADVKFLKPVKLGESVYAQASVTSVSGKKQMVSVEVKREDEVVFKGDFSCFVLEKHVLE